MQAELLSCMGHTGCSALGIFSQKYALPMLQVLVGLVNRDNMMVIIRRALARGSHSNGVAEIEYEDLNKNFVSAAARSLISEQQLAVLQVTSSFALIPCILQGVADAKLLWLLKEETSVTERLCRAS